MFMYKKHNQQIFNSITFGKTFYFTYLHVCKQSDNNNIMSMMIVAKANIIIIIKYIIIFNNIKGKYSV